MCSKSENSGGCVDFFLRVGLLVLVAGGGWSGKGEEEARAARS